MSAETFESLKREEARQRMAALRRARKSPAAARREQQQAGLLDGSVGRITNLRQVLEAMAGYAARSPKRGSKHKRSRSK